MCWTSFVQAAREPLAMNSMLMRQLHILYTVSFNRNTLKTRWCIDWLMEMPWLKVHRNLIFSISLGNGSRCAHSAAMAHLENVNTTDHDMWWFCGTFCLVPWKKVKVSCRVVSDPLSDPMDCNPSGSSVHGISQARLLVWVTISSRGSSRPRDQSQVSWIAGRFFTSWTTREALYWYIHTHLTIEIILKHNSGGNLPS